MSLEKSLCKMVKKHWDDLYSDRPIPDSLISMKVAGKTTPNAAIIIMIFDGICKQPVAVAKIPRNPQLTAGLERENNAMLSLKNSINNSHILEKISHRSTLIETQGIKILLQAAEEGYPMVRELTNRKTVEHLYGKILPWMFELHIDGATDCVLEGKILHKFIKEPIVKFLEQFKEFYQNILSSKSIHYLLNLSTNIEGQNVSLCRQHGDFNAHNILIDFRKKKLNDFTLIDCEDYNSRQLPIHDLNHFFTSNSHLLGGGIPAEDSYTKFILDKGWYNDLYINSIGDYEKTGLIAQNTFLKLTPLYHIEMCFRLAEVQRQQQNTSPTWIKRMNAFINTYFKEIQ